MATFNGAKYVKEQLNSILVLLDADDEVIVSDDGSLDNTVEIINSFCDNRIRVVYNSNEHGYSSNFENALSFALGDYIILSDQDDVWTSSKLKILLSYLTIYDFVVSDAILINDIGEVIADSFYNQRRPFRSLFGNIYKFGYLGCCMAFNRNVLNKALPFPANRRYCTHDNWLLLVGATFFKYKIIDDKLIYYRRHKSNISNGGLKDETSFKFKIFYRLYLIKSILQRWISIRW